MATIRGAFGRAVRRLRKEAGFSQEAFALKAKIDRGYMGRIERGEVNVSLDNIQKLSRALGITPGRLMLVTDDEVTRGP